MRSLHDCLITSSKTIAKDNPKLTCRIDGLTNRSPARVILDRNLNTPINSNIIKESSNYRTIIFYNKTKNHKIELLKKNNVEIYKLPLDGNGNIDLIQSLMKIGKLGFSRIFVEAGAKLSTNFLNNNLVNCLNIFVSSKKLRKNGSYSFKNFLKTFLKNKKEVLEKVNLFDDKLVSYKLK